MLAKDYVSVINIAVLRFACCLCQSYAKHRETLQILQINVIIRLKSLEEFATHLCVGWLFALLVCVTSKTLNPPLIRTGTAFYSFLRFIKDSRLFELVSLRFDKTAIAKTFLQAGWMTPKGSPSFRSVWPTCLE